MKYIAEVAIATVRPLSLVEQLQLAAKVSEALYGLRSPSLPPMQVMSTDVREVS